ncbi:NAD(P)H-dependent oxidoreductase [Bradyrhizobium liaoningense]
MKVFIVHAHPEPQSFSAAMKGAAVEEFERLGHQVVVSDLYAMQFNAVASIADFTNRANPDYCVYALEQRHAVQNNTLAPDAKAELDKLLWCDLLVLNFPIFWFSTPAILKGWIDRVFVSGVTYGGKRFYDRGGLRGKGALVSVTLGGQEHMFDPESVHGALESMLKPLLQGTLAYVGFKVYRPFVGWHVPYISNEARTEVLAAWRRRIRHLDEQPTLVMPSLNDFDDALHPIKTERKADSGETNIAAQGSFV